MSEREHDDGVVGRDKTVERHVAGIAERNDQLAQLGIACQGAADFGVLLEKKKPLPDLTSGAIGSRSRFRLQKAATTRYPTNRRLGDDQSWHSGTGLSSLPPQLSSQSRNSSPVICRPVV